MSLLGRLARFFSRSAQNSGTELYYNGSANLTLAEPDVIAGEVRDGSQYEAVLELDSDTILYSCTCPPYQHGLEACKHVWALILKAENAGHMKKWDLKHLDFIPDDAVDDAWDEFASDEFDDEDDDQVLGYVEMEAPSRSPEGIPERRRSGEPAGNRQIKGITDGGEVWNQHFSQVRRAMESRAPASISPKAGPSREVLYVINANTSMATGNIALETHVRERKKNGEWGKPKPQGISLQAIPALPDPVDRELQSHLLGIPRAAKLYTAYGSAIRFQIPGSMADILLPSICRTGRCMLKPLAGTGYLPVRWDDGEPWEFWLEVKKDPERPLYHAGGSLRRGEQRLDLMEPEILFQSGIMITREFIARFNHFNSFPWISLLRRARPEIRENQRGDWLRELLTLPYLPRLDLPPEMHFECHSPKPVPILRVRVDSSRWRPTTFTADLLFNYEGRIIGQDDPGTAVAEQDKMLRILRNPDAEQAARRRAAEAGLRPRNPMGGRSQWELASPLLPIAARTLLAEGWQVEADGKAFRRPGALQIEVRSGIDWFELHGKVDFGEVKAGLPELLAALKRGDRMIRLGDGSYGMLPEEWLNKYGRLASYGKSDNDHLRFNRCQAGLLDVLLASQPEAACDAVFAKVRDELRSFERVEAVDPPSGFCGELRSYQREGLGWFHFLRRFSFGGCLADDMGLGKTVQVLALLEERRQLRSQFEAARPRPSLVVVPRSLVFNWMKEAERFTPRLRALNHTGADRAKDSGHFEPYDLVITTYGTLRRDALVFKDARFDYVILDEAQAIKNSGTESAKAARLLHGDYRLALSGTPIENHLGELWSLFEFLNPGMLGSASVFRMPEQERVKPDEGSRALLAGALRPFILRRTKEQVAPDLPPKTEQTLYCELEGAQRRLYNELRDHYRNSLLGMIEREGLAKSKIQVLEALLRLRQAACHPGLIDHRRGGESSAKLEMLLPQLEEVLDEGHKALVFSQFTSMLAIVRSRLDGNGIRYEYLDGQTLDRSRPVERFQNDPECRLFLISLKAGGLGLNLTAAEYVFLLDPWWNPAVEAQAIDRTHRIGQMRPVFAYRLIAKETVEEKVLELQKAKRDLAEAIIGGDNSLIRDLRREDLELLLS